MIERHGTADQASVSLDAAATDDGSLEEGSRARRRFYRAAFTTDTPVAVHAAVWRIENNADSFPDDSGGSRFAVIRDLEHRKDDLTAAAVRLKTNAADSTWTLAVDTAQFDSLINSPPVAPGVRDPAGLPAMLVSVVTLLLASILLFAIPALWLENVVVGMVDRFFSKSALILLNKVGP